VRGQVPGRRQAPDAAGPGPRAGSPGRAARAPGERAFGNPADYLRRISSRRSVSPAIVTWFSPAPTPSRGGPDRAPPGNPP